MSFWSAVGGLLGGLFGGKKKSSAAQAPVASVPAADMDNYFRNFMLGYLSAAAENRMPLNEAYREAMAEFMRRLPIADLVWRGEELRGHDLVWRGEQPPIQRLGGRQPLGQRANQLGGMSYPSPPYALWLGDMGAGKSKGKEGRGAGALPAAQENEQEAKQRRRKIMLNILFGRPQSGGGSGSTGGTAGASNTLQDWRRLLAAMSRQTGMWGGLAPQFTSYMASALAGRAGLPEEAYRRELLRGQEGIFAQERAARQRLLENLAARGLERSGLLASGLRGIEEAGLGALGTLYSQLAQQRLQSAEQAQREAAQRFLGLYGAEQEALINAIRNWLELRRLELEERRVKQAGRAQESSLWGAIGGVLADIFGGGGTSGGGTSSSGGGGLATV